MSADGGRRRGAFVPKAVEQPAPPARAAASPTATPPGPLATTLEATPPATCAACKHWRGEPGDSPKIGRCVVVPPSVPVGATALGPLHTYRVTAADELACGRAEPKPQQSSQ